MFDFFVDESRSITANADMGIDLGTFIEGNGEPVVTVEPSKPKRKKTVKTTEIVVDTSNGQSLINPIPGGNVAEMDYSKSYAEPAMLIRGAIAQADQLMGEVKSDIDDIRASKTMKSKYTYLTNLTSAAGSLLATKVSAVKELSAIATQVNRFELDRFKTLKLDAKEETDDKRMMDIYSAFVNTPIGSYNPPSIQDITLGVNAINGGINSVDMVSVNGGNDNVGLTPEQNRMRMEANHNIQTVVRYDQSTGQRAFDVIDKVTGASVPNYPRPDNFLLEDTTIDVHSGIARNRNINEVWPLVVNGGNYINEY